MKRAKTKDIRKQIMEAAKELFATRGIKGVTVAEIAKEASVAKATVYKYFESKEEIFQEVIHDEAMRVYEEIDQAVRKASSTREKLKVFVLAKIDSIRKRVNLHHITRKRFWDISMVVRRELSFYYEQEIMLVKHILNQGIEKGEIEVKEPSLVARALVAVAKEFEDPWLIEDEDVERILNALLDVLFDGLKPRKEGC